MNHLETLLSIYLGVSILSNVLLFMTFQQKDKTISMQRKFIESMSLELDMIQKEFVILKVYGALQKFGK